ncbi:FMN-dependent NADH-azoreductase [Bartonella sp. HY038]|uniref:FMN-dependent NADH-azoreductase n=1 Tax=Bartonella sp. HY038 TaxID=2759660 RepID=UPI0015FA0B32|nr:NAD(P)H-dependent oxidoreductase [Bartonella sp. HY038]
MRLLHIKVSQDLEGSSSRKASAYLVDKLKALHPDISETIIDLAQNPLPHLDSAMITAIFTKPELRNEAQWELLKKSDELVDQLFNHEILVISSPIYNLGLPSVLKAWFDHVTRAGRTFAFKSDGTKTGLVHNLKAFCVFSTGSIFSAGPFVSDDQFTPYVRVALEYIGIKDLTNFRIEGTQDAKTRDTALAHGLKQIDHFFEV